MAIDMYKREYIPLDPPAKTRSGLQRGDRVIVSRLPSVQELNHWKIMVASRTGQSNVEQCHMFLTPFCVHQFDDLTKLNGFNYPMLVSPRRGPAWLNNPNDDSSPSLRISWDQGAYSTNAADDLT